MHRVYSKHVMMALLGERVIIEFMGGDRYVGLLTSDSRPNDRPTTPFDGKHYTLYLNTFGLSVSFVRSAIRRIVDPASGAIYTKEIGPTWYGLRKPRKVEPEFWEGKLLGGE